MKWFKRWLEKGGNIGVVPSRPIPYRVREVIVSHKRFNELLADLEFRTKRDVKYVSSGETARMEVYCIPPFHTEEILNNLSGSGFGFARRIIKKEYPMKIEVGKAYTDKHNDVYDVYEEIKIHPLAELGIERMFNARRRSDGKSYTVFNTTFVSEYVEQPKERYEAVFYAGEKLSSVWRDGIYYAGTNISNPIKNLNRCRHIAKALNFYEKFSAVEREGEGLKEIESLEQKYAASLREINGLKESLNYLRGVLEGALGKVKF